MGQILNREKVFPMGSVSKIVFLIFFFLLVSSCERDITVDLPKGEEKLVVEGYIENGLPPYVILTHNVPVFSQTNVDDISNLFVHDAFVQVTDGIDTVTLREYNSDNLPENVKRQLANIFQVDEEVLTGNNDEDQINFSLYSIPLGNFFLGKENTRYQLMVKTGQYIARAETVVRSKALVDSIFFKSVGVEDLVRLFIRINDPADEVNYYRYFTKRNREPFYAGYLASVANDKLVNGSTFIFPIDRGEPRAAKVNFDLYGYFFYGDTVVVKFCDIDKAHYDFWNSLEEDFRNQGNPFGSPTIIQSNVDGALGVWGGYCCDYDTLIIK